jgi:anti-sigma factor RsiW
MKPCPSAQELEQLLDEELSDAQQEALAKHVASCPSCQTTLYRLTEGADSLPSVARSGGSDHGKGAAEIPDSQAAFLAHLKESPPPSISRTGANGLWPFPIP